MYAVYILYSKKINRYYAGSTNNFTDRLRRHNAGLGKYTKKGIPWFPINVIQVKTRSEAVRLESRIKKRGIARYLSDTNFGV